MLVLSRHRDESIMIGDDIAVTVIDIRGDKVRLGIETPSSIPVHRQEVYEAIQRENRKTAFNPTRFTSVTCTFPGCNKLATVEAYKFDRKVLRCVEHAKELD